MPLAGNPASGIGFWGRRSLIATIEFSAGGRVE
jgi:hypothetical protein